MKPVRLIKRKPAIQANPQGATQKAAQETRTIKNAVRVVGLWAKERRAAQQQNARQMFAALFAKTQVE